MYESVIKSNSSNEANRIAINPGQISNKHENSPRSVWLQTFISPEQDDCVSVIRPNKHLE